MRWTSTVILLLVTIALGVYVSVYELKQPTPEERRQQAHEVVDLAPSDVTSMQIVAPTITATLTRDHDRWRLSAPVAGRAEEAAVLRLLYFLHPLSAQRVLETTPKRPLAPADYGLQPPKATLTVTTSRGVTILTFGDGTAVGESTYVRRSDRAEVYIVRGFVFKTLNQPVEAFRSHALLEFDGAALGRLTMMAPAHSYTLVRTAKPDGAPNGPNAPEGWRLVEPIAEIADPEAVRRLIGVLQRLRIEQFVAEQATPEQLAQWGLTAPERQIALTVEGREQPMEIRVGLAVTGHDGWRYVRVSTEPNVYAVAAAELEPLWADLSTLKAKPPSSAPPPLPSASPSPSTE